VFTNAENVVNYYYKFLKSFNKLFTDNGKPVETLGRKATGPVTWQPAPEEKVFFIS
jgi:hypothetical protein